MSNDFPPPFTSDDIRNLECIRTGRLTMGKQVRAFEEELADYLGAKHVVMVNSGSSACLLAVSVLRILMPEVRSMAIPATTWPTMFWPAVLLGMDVLVVDIDMHTLCIPSDDDYGTDSVFSVHLLGQPCNLTHKVLIEDACEALGTVCDDGKMAGTRGLMGTFSFYWSHHLSTIEGGAVATNDDAVRDELLMQRAHGWTRDLSENTSRKWHDDYPYIRPEFLFPTVGFNFRPTEIQAELGRIQIPKLNDWLIKRTEIAASYGRIACQNPSIGSYPLNRGSHSWFACPLVLKNQNHRNSVLSRLSDQGILTRPIVAGDLTLQPLVDRAKFRMAGGGGGIKNASRVLFSGLYLPISPLQSDEYTAKIVEAIHGL